jgi:subtilisin
VIDTGIFPHADLKLGPGVSYVPGSPSTVDQNGHGTHVSGTIAAVDNTSYVVGEAPGVTLHPVRVLDSSGSGQISWVIAGINYVAAWKQANPSIPVVANMSLGAETGTSSLNAMDQAIQKAMAKGVVFCVAAGNSNKDARGFSPAHTPGTICVGSYGQTNRKSSFSNYGPAVTISAPGEVVPSTWLNNGIQNLSGTSMATPAVTGTVALMLSTQPTLTVAQAKQRILTIANSSTTNQNPRIQGFPSGTSNLSVWTGAF